MRYRVKFEHDSFLSVGYASMVNRTIRIADRDTAEIKRNDANNIGSPLLIGCDVVTIALNFSESNCTF